MRLKLIRIPYENFRNFTSANLDFLKLKIFTLDSDSTSRKMHRKRVYKNFQYEQKYVTANKTLVNKIYSLDLTSQIEPDVDFVEI